MGARTPTLAVLLIVCAGALDLRARVTDAAPTRRDDPPGVAAVSPAFAQPQRAPGSGLPLPRLEQVDAGRLERLERWLKAVARHAPGEDDESLEQTASLTNTGLKELWLDVNVLIQTMRGHAGDRFSVRGEGQKTSTLLRLEKPQVRRFWVLACAADGRLLENPCQATHTADEADAELRQLSILVRAARSRGDDNYIIRRGALLHGDVPMLAPASMVASDPGPVSVGERYRMEISDGREVDLRQAAVHWEIARMLLAFVKPHDRDRPAPQRDSMVRAWYRATAAWMQWREDHDSVHLASALELFPDDPDILFLSATQHETYAGPPIQTAVQSAVLPTGMTMGVGSRQLELRQAELLFHRALEIKPDYAEARLHEGRVLGELGKHAEAAIALRLAVTELAETHQRYYGELFLGAEEEQLGNREAGAAAYDRAAALAPRAQSPLLALSQLARRYGDRAGALRTINRLFALQAEDRDLHDDPWWSYDVAQARNAEDLLEALWQPFLQDRLQ